MTITNKVKELLSIEYPNSKFVDDIIECRYINDILYMKRSDGRKIVYIFENGEVIVFTENIGNFSKKSILIAKKVMRELKLSQLVENE